jgi:hypothetical protein
VDDDIYRPYIGSYGHSENELRMVVDTNGDGDLATGGNDFEEAQLRFEWWHQYNQYLRESFSVKIGALRYGIMESWLDETQAQRYARLMHGQIFDAQEQPLHGVSALTYGDKRLELPWSITDTSQAQLFATTHKTEDRGFGGTTSFVQPILPGNEGETADAFSKAILAFNNAPIYWSGYFMYNDAAVPSARAVKSVRIPWHRLEVGANAELALASDVAPVQIGKFQNATGSIQLALDGRYLALYDGGNAVTAYYDATGGDTRQVSWPTTAVTNELKTRIDGLMNSIVNAEQAATSAANTAQQVYREVSDIRTEVDKRITETRFRALMQSYDQQITLLNNSMNSLNTRYTESMQQMNDVIAATPDTGAMATAISNVVAELEVLKQAKNPSGAQTTETASGARAITWQANPIKIEVYSYSPENTGQFLFKKDGWPELVRTEIVFDTRGLTGANNGRTGFTYLSSNFPTPDDSAHMSVFFMNGLENATYNKYVFATAVRVGDDLYIWPDLITHELD